VPRLRLAAPLLAVALVLAACGGSGDEEAAAAAEPLDFVAPDVRGGQVVGADYTGQAMVIWFWAPW
jgi:ABC-type glycerol-3-phosphate transport system substrate-binding protein